jgi:hypothetical protein
MKYKKKMTKISGLVKGTKTTEFGVLWWLAVWLTVQAELIQSVCYVWW